MSHDPFHALDDLCGPQEKTINWARAFLRSIWVIPVMGFVITLLLLAVEHPQLSQVTAKFLASLTYTACIAIPSSFILNWIGFRLSGRRPRLESLIYAAALLIIATAGTLAGAAILDLAHLAGRGMWIEFRGSWPFATVISLVIGLSMVSFETMRHKLQAATIELRTRQVEQERANKLMVEARLSSLESRIHPHFLFNTLNSIAALIPSDPRRAEDTVGKLASLLRFSLNANHASLVPLAQELKVVRDYLEIESTRFGPRLCYEIAVPDSLGDCRIPPLALQTLVENSIKHVVAQRAEGGSLRIAGARANGLVHLDVIDDGPGFSLAAISPEHGLGNLSARLELLYGERGRLDVLRSGAETIARISYPAEA